MSKQPQQRGKEVKGGQRSQQPPLTVPIVLILDRFVPAVVAPYCNNVITALQALHPNSQLLLTSLTPSPYALPIQPFLSPTAFMASLPGVMRQPARPTPSVWRSETGMLRAIVSAKKLLEGGPGSEKRAQTPRYVVVISGTDLESSDAEEIWLEDEEPVESWESFAGNFTKGAHTTTLFSLISLGHTPNLETFWKACSSRFPPNLVFNSTAPLPNTHTFPFTLYAATHACFLVGFYNTRNAPPSASASAASTPVSAPSPAVAVPPPKRVAAPEPATANKKQKPNVSVPPPPIPPASQAAVQQYLASQAQGANAAKLQQQSQQQAVEAHARSQAQAQLVNAHADAAANLQQQQNAQRLAAAQAGQQNALYQTLPALGQPKVNLDQYVLDSRSAASTRPGGPPLNIAEAQAAQAAMTSLYGGAQVPNSTFNPSLPTNRPPSQPGHLPPGNEQLAGLNQQQTALQRQQAVEAQRRAQNLPPQHKAEIPSSANEMQVRIQLHYEQIKSRTASGQYSAEESAFHMKRLQEITAHHRGQLANQRANGLQPPAAPTGQPATLAGQVRAPSAQGLPNPYASAPHAVQQQYASQAAVAAQSQQYANQAAASAQSQQYAASQAAAAAHNQQQPRQPPSGVLWRGPFTWVANEGGAAKERVAFCHITPMSAHNMRDLTDITWPNVLRVSSVLPIKMSELQEMATSRKLPAISIQSISNEVLGPEQRAKMQAQYGHGNAELFAMFTQSILNTCGLIKFDNTSILVVATPQNARLIGIVFVNIPIPEHWLAGVPGSISRPIARSSQAPPQHPSTAFAPQFQPQNQPGMNPAAFSQANLNTNTFAELSTRMSPEQIAQLLNQTQRGGAR